VNRNEFDVDGPQLAIPAEPGKHYYDLWHGVELQPAPANGMAALSFDLESLGFGAILATRDVTDQAQIRELMEFMSERSRRPLGTYSREWKPVSQTIVEIAPTKPASSAPSGMVRIPEADFDFNVKGIEIEGGNDPGVDVQYPWENEPRRTHHHRLHLHSFYIDRTPVTNAEFGKFLDNTHYHPADDHNFLRDWQNGTYPKGWENKPVTWLSLEDARTYCQSNGKRLPHEWEWQYAAQSADGRAYPWGANWRPDALRVVDHGPQIQPPSDVNAFPYGASPFGVFDLVGNVSQWTDEYQDPHTRAAIVRGGASYEPAGSIWYLPQTYRLDEHEKYLLMSPGRDRAGTIGFRCVVDAP
jgi:gamma-glutamyl hercynylcysteine S-oxide synthase